MPTLRCPPADKAANITGNVVRPIPVADQVAPAGQRRHRRHEGRRGAGHATGHPITRSQWTFPP